MDNNGCGVLFVHYKLGATNSYANLFGFQTNR